MRPGLRAFGEALYCRPQLVVQSSYTPSVGSAQETAEPHSEDKVCERKREKKGRKGQREGKGMELEKGTFRVYISLPPSLPFSPIPR